MEKFLFCRNAIVYFSPKRTIMDKTMDTISLSSEWDAPQHWQWKGYSISQYLRAACGRVIRFEHWAFFNSSIIANNYIFCIFLPSFCYWLREWIHIGLYYQAHQGQCTCGKKCIWKFGHNAWALEWSRSTPLPLPTIYEPGFPSKD